MQQVLGKTYFCDLQLIVNEHVLIPRPETEELVYLIQESITTPESILDIGTGSGCIPLALKSLFSEAHILGVDISKEALNVAQENARKTNLKVNFTLFDILDKTQWEGLGNFDVVVSNPPYIPWKEKKALDKNVVEYEPGLALFSPDDNPAVFYFTIIEFAKQKLSTKGHLFFELNPDFAQEVQSFATQRGFHAKIIHDLQGKARFLKAQERT